jgi:hypothetical protein
LSNNFLAQSHFVNPTFSRFLKRRLNTGRKRLVLIKLSLLLKIFGLQINNNNYAQDDLKRDVSERQASLDKLGLGYILSFNCGEKRE